MLPRSAPFDAPSRSLGILSTACCKLHSESTGGVFAAVASAITASQNTASPTSLVSLAFDEELTSDETSVLKDKPKSGVGVIRDAVAAVSANSPGDRAEFGRLLVHVATRVAEASKEGGFLGVGGTQVSETELKAIDEIRALVGIAA